MSGQPDPPWWRYHNDPQVLLGIVLEHGYEIERLRRIIDELDRERTAINNYLDEASR